MLFTFWSTERCFSSSWLACRVNDFRPLCNTSLGTVRPGSSKRLISASTSTRVIQKANNSFILPFVFGAYQKKYNEFGTVAASSEGAFWGAKISSTAGVNFCFFVGCFSSPALAGSVFDSSSFFPSSTCVVFSCIRFLPRLHSSFSSSASFKAALTRDWACRKCNMILTMNKWNQNTWVRLQNVSSSVRGFDLHCFSSSLGTCALSFCQAWGRCF